jgi:hypothetical protein
MAETIGLLAFSAIGFSTAAGFTIGATSITLGAVVGTAILVGGSIGLQMLTAPRIPDAPGTRSATPTGVSSLPPPEAGHVPLRQAIPPRTVAYGRVRLAGTYVLFESDADSTSWDIIAFHHGRIGGIIGYYFHDDIIGIDTNNGTVIGLPDGRYGFAHCFIDTRLGFPVEQAYPQPITAMPEIWTSAHRGDGIASMMLRCDVTNTPVVFSAIYPRGKPEPSVVVDACLIYDPRDPAQSRLDPNSHKTSTNPVVQLLHYLTSEDHGMGLDWNTLVQPVLPALIGEMNLADGIVIRSNGIGEYKYSSAGAFQIDSEPTEIVNAILDTCDGWLSENGDGTIALKVGVYRPPVVTIRGKHIRGINLQFDLADEEIVNELSIDYTEPALDYKTISAEPWRNEEDILERGRVRSQRFALPWVQSFTQARRLAKRRDAQNNAELRGTLTTTLFGLTALGERWIRVQAPELPALDDVVIEVRGVTIDLLNASLTFKFISVDEDTIDDWNAAEEGPAIVIPPKLISKPPPVLGGGPFAPVPSIAAWYHRQVGPPAAIYESYAFVSFINPEQGGLQYQIQFRIVGTPEWTLEPPQPLVGSPTVTGQTGIPCLFNTTPAFLGQNYEVQIRSIPPIGLPGASDWSFSMVVTTSDNTEG